MVNFIQYFFRRRRQRNKNKVVFVNGNPFQPGGYTTIKLFMAVIAALS
jgi:hypothetical protein